MSTRIELHAGLGDIFLSLHRESYYENLFALTSRNRISIYINSHNPFVREIFDWHPVHERLDIFVSRQFFPENTNPEVRVKYGFPPEFRHGPFRPRDPGPLPFYPSPLDSRILKDLVPRRPFLLAALSASSPPKSIPAWIAEAAVGECRSRGIPVILTGRTYHPLFNPLLKLHHEEVVVGGDGVVNLIDRLTIPGTAIVLKRCSAMLSCHSALNILGWFERKPQFLCYPESIRRLHFSRQEPDLWSFGKDYPETRHMTFDRFTPQSFGRFLDEYFPRRPQEETVPGTSRAICPGTARKHLGDREMLRYQRRRGVDRSGTAV